MKNLICSVSCSLLTIALAILKMLGYIDCSWFVVILPVLVSLMLSSRA